MLFDALVVLAVLHDGAERVCHHPLVELGRPEATQRRRPVDRLGDARRLVERQPAQRLDGAGDLACELGIDAGHTQLDDRDFALESRMLDPVVQAAPLERVVDVAGAVRSEDHDWWLFGREHPHLRDRDLEVGQHFEEVGLELVVGAIDLVDQQHWRGAFDGLDGAQQRPLDEESLAVELGFEFISRTRRRFAGGLSRAQVQQLAGVVPVVDRLRDVDALVTLQAYELAAGCSCQGLGQLGLADTSFAFEQQRAVQRHGQEHRRRDPLVGQVAVA